jgi:hypothetical protein
VRRWRTQSRFSQRVDTVRASGSGGGSTTVRWSRFLRCHYVRVGVVLWGQSSSEEMQNSIECLMEKIHEVAHSFFAYFTSRGLRTGDEGRKVFQIVSLPVARYRSSLRSLSLLKFRDQQSARFKIDQGRLCSI